MVDECEPLVQSGGEFVEVVDSVDSDLVLVVNGVGLGLSAVFAGDRVDLREDHDLEMRVVGLERLSGRLVIVGEREAASFVAAVGVQWAWD